MEKIVSIALIPAWLACASGWAMIAGPAMLVQTLADRIKYC